LTILPNSYSGGALGEVGAGLMNCCHPRRRGKDGSESNKISSSGGGTSCWVYESMSDKGFFHNTRPQK
jgi:hypothetical protein